MEESQTRMKPPAGPQQFFKNRNATSKKGKEKPSAISFNIQDQTLQQQQAQQQLEIMTDLVPKQLAFKQLSQAERDFEESIGVGLKHTLNPVSHFTPAQTAKYSLTMKVKINDKKQYNSESKYKNNTSLSSKKYYIKEEKQLYQAIKTLHANPNQDLYDTLNYQSPAKTVQRQNNLKLLSPSHLNFINVKQSQLNQRTQTSHQQPKPILKTSHLYSQTPQHNRHFSLNNNMETIQNQLSDENIIKGQFDIDKLNEKVMEQHVITRVLTHNNYSAMLSNIQKRKKFNQLEHRFLQTMQIIDMLPHDSRAKVIENTQSTLLQENLLQKFNQHSRDIHSSMQMYSPKINQNIMVHDQPNEENDYSPERQETDATEEIKIIKVNNNLAIQQNPANIKKEYVLNSSTHSPPQNINQIMQSKKNSVAVTNADPQQSIKKIKTLINNASKLEKKLNENLQNSKFQIEEDVNQPNQGEKQYKIRQEIKKIKQHFNKLKVGFGSINPKSTGLVANTDEEILKTRTHNNATFFYVNENEDQFKQRKLEEEKLIKDFVSERDAFMEKQNRTKVIITGQLHQNKRSMDTVEEIGQIKLEDFMKEHKINPKIFTADTIGKEKVKTSENIKLKPNTNKKHYYIQKSVLLIQTQKIAQARSFLINALKEFPGDVTLLFNKALVHFLNKEFRESLDINYYLLSELSYKNAVLINIFLSHLKQEQYEEVLHLIEQIQPSDTYLDNDEKNLKKLYLYSKERLKLVDYGKYEKHLKWLKDKRMKKEKSNDDQKQDENIKVKQQNYSFVDKSRMNVDMFQSHNQNAGNSSQDSFIEGNTTLLKRRRQWSFNYSRDRHSKSNSQSSLLARVQTQKSPLMHRKASADTELSTKVKQGLALYIAKKNQLILKKKEEQLKKRYSQIQEKLSKQSSSIKGSQKRISVEYLNDIDIVDRLNEDKIKEKQELKKPYEGFNFDFKKKRSENSLDYLKNQLKKQNTSKFKKSPRNSAAPAGTNNNSLDQFPIEFSNELREAITRIEQEMQDNKDYFLSRLKKINTKFQELGPQFDPIQQEFDIIMEEIELLKKEMKGEENLYKFINYLLQKKKDGSLTKKPTLNLDIEMISKQDFDQLYAKLKQKYTRAICLLLETNNSQYFYKNEVNGFKKQSSMTRNQVRSGLGLQNTSSFGSRANSKNASSRQLNNNEWERRHSKQSSQNQQMSIRDEIEMSFMNLEKRLNEYKDSKTETEDQKLMRILGITYEQVEERKKIQKGITGHILMSKAERDLVKEKRNHEEFIFDDKTMEFLDYLFENYGLQEVIVPGTQEKSLFKEVEQMNEINSYLNQLAMYATTRSSDLNHLHKYKNTNKQGKKDTNEEEKLNITGSIDAASESNKQDPETKEKSQIENFQKLLELKIMEKMGEQKYEECDFYQAMIQKLNTIDILQSYIKKCAKAIMNDEDQIIKKELSFAMLQIFREQISKKEILDRQKINRVNNANAMVEDVDYEIIDKTIKRLKFFKIFEPKVRQKLYRIARYQIVPPNRIIVRKEEIDQMIIVIINGTASLMVKDLEQDATFALCTLFPGESLGDVNLTSTLKHKEDQTQTYVQSDRECDVLVFDRKAFANVLFQEMRDSLYEKIITLKNSEFFESISPYALVILCSNIEIKEYSYGDVIVRQDQEPEFCYIIVQGDCKIAYETVIYKTREEIQGPAASRKNQGSFHFNQQTYNPSDDVEGFKKKKKPTENHEEEPFFSQKKINEKFSFQNERLENQVKQNALGGQSLNRTPQIGNTPSNKSGIMSNFMKTKNTTQQEEMLAFRHHIHYDKLVQGKCFCARTLLEKDYVKKFIEREYDEFKSQLQLPSPSFIVPSQGTETQDRTVKNSNTMGRASFVQKKRLEADPILRDHESNKDFYRNLNNQSSKALKRDMLEQERQRNVQTSQEIRKNQQRIEMENQMKNNQQEQYASLIRDMEIRQMYDALMKSQLTVIADSASVKVIVISRKSKKYLSEPLKAVIDNKILNLKFKDYDRPFKNQQETTKFLENDKNWEQFKNKITATTLKP